MKPVLQIRNRQKTRRIDTRWYRKVIRHLLQVELGLKDFELCFHLVDDREMTSLNETFLRHEGSTDVITFDLRDMEPGDGLGGEIFVCVDEALRQADRYRTSWTSETVRYAVHGILHLLGLDDQSPPARQVMKRKENRLMDKLEKQFALRSTGGKNSCEP